jgi:hypothetical protein
MRITRYFKATDGSRTYFRASETKIYQSIIVYPSGYVSFSSKPAGKSIIVGGDYPAIEIDAAAYRALQAAKMARVRALYMAKGVDPLPRGAGTAPTDSWVRNADLVETEAA